MKKLLRIEFRKMIHNRIFWLSLLGYALIMVLTLLMMRFQIIRFNERIQEGAGSFIPLIPTEIYSFPHVWHNLTFIGRFFKIFPGIFMVILVSNEYVYNTLRQNYISGLSRFQLVFAKFLDGIMLALFATLLIFIFGLISGFATTNNIEFTDIFEKMAYLPAYFLMLAGFLTFVMMLAFLIKKPVFTIGIILIYIFIAEPVLASKFSESFGNYLPVRAMNLLIEIPDTPIFALFSIKPDYDGISALHVVLSLVYTVIFFGISYLYIKRKDL